MPVMLPAVPPMLRVEVESAVGEAVPPVPFPRMVLAAWVASLVSATPPVVRVRVEFAPPTKAPRVPPMVNSELGVKVVVATFAKVLAPLKYGMLPTTAAVEVERPEKEIAEPDTAIGKVPEMEPSFELKVPQSVLERRPVRVADAFWKSVEVATNVGAAAPPVPLAKTVLAPAVAAYEVVFPTEVMTPERFALVVTVAALPLMFMLTGEEVETDANVLTPVAYRRPDAAEISEEVAMPPQVRFGAVPPDEMMGQVPVTLVTLPPPPVEVAIHPMPFAVLLHPRTYPPAGATP